MKIILICILTCCSILSADSKTEVDDKEIGGLIKELGAENFKTRRAAKKKLILLGPAIVEHLEKELKGSKDPEVIANLKEVLTKLMDFPKMASGTWKGHWESANSPGYLFEFNMKLEVGDDLNVSGQIEWTLLKAPDNRNIGKTAIEHIKGTADKEKKSVDFKGFKQDDPLNIISLDEYKVEIDKSGRELNGKTSSSGSWKGIFIGKKVIDGDK